MPVGYVQVPTYREAPLLTAAGVTGSYEMPMCVLGRELKFFEEQYTLSYWATSLAQKIIFKCVSKCKSLSKSLQVTYFFLFHIEHVLISLSRSKYIKCINIIPLKYKGESKHMGGWGRQTSEFQASLVYTQFQVSWGYIKKPCLKKINFKQRRQLRRWLS